MRLIQIKASLTDSIVVEDRFSLACIPFAPSIVRSPTFSDIPQSLTMCAAIDVACFRSLLAPDVILSAPKINSSAARPPSMVSIIAKSCDLVT